MASERVNAVMGDLLRLRLKRPLNFLLTRLSLKLGKPVSWGLPYRIMIEPTNTCNLKCPGCPTGAGTLGRSRGFMKLSDFQRIIDELGDTLYEIVLWNYGEPFMHPDLFKMVRYAADRGIAVIESTNGMLVTSDKVDEILDSGLSKLIICLDGVTQETLSKYRVNSSVEDVVENIRALTEGKKKRGQASPEIEFQFILMKHNQEELEKAREIARDLGVDVFTVKSVGMMYKNLVELIPDGDFFRRYDEDGTPKVYFKNQCSRLWFSTVIDWDGTVVPCCFDYSEKHPMGNALKEGLRNVWKGEKYREFRKQILADKTCFEICKNCPGDTPKELLVINERIE